ncbi:branched-chain amino acid ABC transporter permease [Halosolutus amylolyticus]|uniref:Branched-chain amino acid ABC transporter permease n=1 Tax=Halosolutus amylolyticus TaxID=2932267 RepID=A0ABD5PPD4_9EURY|nr:branched-chain amino acid ABC transporter permease [Halosolutus amylolyticus]
MAISPTDPDRDRVPDGGADSALESPADEDDSIDAGSTAPTDSSDENWLAAYTRDHAAHLLVVAAFALYPVVLGVLDRTPLATEASSFLPGLTAMIVVLYMGLFAMSFDFVSGYTGYLSFGHAAFYGTGAYVVVLAANGKVPGVPADTPFMVLLLLAAVLAFVVALAIGAVSFRLSGVYFAMITLGFAQVIYEFVRHWEYVGANPSEGATISRVDGLSIGVPYVDSLNVAVGRLAGDSFENVLGMGVDVSATMTSYYALGVVVLVCYFAMQRILHSPFGAVMVAIRENEERARAIGYDVFWYKMAAFSASGFFAGIAGAVFAAYARGASPDNSFYFLVTADALIMAIIGGIGTLAGPLYGALFHEWLEDILTTENDGIATYLEQLLPQDVLTTEVAGMTLSDFFGTVLTGRAPLYLGIIFVLFVLFVPDGLLGSVRNRVGGPVGKRLPAVLDRYRR